MAFANFKIHKQCDTPYAQKDKLYIRGKSGQCFYVEYLDKNRERTTAYMQLNHRFTIPERGRFMAFVGHIFKPTPRQCTTKVTIKLEKIKVLRRISTDSYIQHFDRLAFGPPANNYPEPVVPLNEWDTETVSSSSEHD